MAGSKVEQDFWAHGEPPEEEEEIHSGKGCGDGLLVAAICCVPSAFVPLAAWSRHAQVASAGASVNDHGLGTLLLDVLAVDAAGSPAPLFSGTCALATGVGHLAGDRLHLCFDFGIELDPCLRPCCPCPGPSAGRP